MNWKTLLLTITIVTCWSISCAQELRFKHYSGKLYTLQQKDSIAKAGNIVSFQDTTQLGETTIISFYFYDRTLTYSAFQKKYYKKPLPKIKLADLDGNLVDTDALKGKIVMINFWSTTCAPCIAEMPQLNDLARDYSPRVVFIGIAPENSKKVRSLLKKFRFDFTIIADAEQLFEAFGIDGYPKNFFVDEQGVIRYIEVGTPVANGPGGKVIMEDGKWKVLVYERYSKILDELLQHD